MNVCIALSPILMTAQKLSLVLQVVLAPYPWILVIMNPAGPFLASLYAHSSIWVYLAVGGLRCCIFMPTSYIVGKYGRAYVQAKVDRRRERRGGSRARWTQGAQQRFARVVGPTKTRVMNHPVVVISLRSFRAGLKRAGAWLNEKFPKYGWALVFIRPNQWHLMAAGATGMKPWICAVSAVTGTLAWLALVAYLGEYIPHLVLFIFSIY